VVTLHSQAFQIPTVTSNAIVVETDVFCASDFCNDTEYYVMTFEFWLHSSATSPFPNDYIVGYPNAPVMVVNNQTSSAFTSLATGQHTANNHSRTGHYKFRTIMAKKMLANTDYFLHLKVQTVSSSGVGTATYWVTNVRMWDYVESVEVTNQTLHIPVEIQNFPATQDVNVINATLNTNITNPSLNTNATIVNDPLNVNVTGNTVTSDVVIKNVDIGNQLTTMNVLIGGLRENQCTNNSQHTEPKKYEGSFNVYGNEQTTNAIKIFNDSKELDRMSAGKPNGTWYNLFLELEDEFVASNIDMNDSCVTVQQKNNKSDEKKINSNKQLTGNQVVRMNRRQLENEKNEKKRKRDDEGLISVVAKEKQDEQERVKKQEKLETVVSRIADKIPNEPAFYQWILSLIKNNDIRVETWFIRLVAKKVLDARRLKIGSFIKGLRSVTCRGDIFNLLCCCGAIRSVGTTVFRDFLLLASECGNDFSTNVYIHRDWSGYIYEPQKYIQIWDDSNAILEGSFNPYGNGQTDPLTIAGTAIGTALLSKAANTAIEKVPDIVSGLGNVIIPQKVGYDDPRIIQDVIIEDYRSNGHELTPEEKYHEKKLIERGAIESVLLNEMQKESGRALTRKEADKFLRLNSNEPSWTDKILTGLVGQLGENKYIGPNYTGGKLGGVATVRDLAESLSVQPKSRLDQIARKHDMMYAIAKDKKTQAKADEKMIEEIQQLEDKNVQEYATLGALKAKSTMDMLTDLFGRSDYDKTNEVKEGSFNPYGNGQWTDEIGYDKRSEIMEGSFNPYGNGQWVDYGKLFAALIDRLVNDYGWNDKTLRGLAPIGLLTTGVQLDSQVHDPYFMTRGSRREYTYTQLATMIDGIVSAFSFFPRVIRGADGILTANLNVNNYVSIKSEEGGDGPRLVVGPMALALDEAERSSDMIALGQQLNLANAIANGLLLYKLFSMTKGDPSDGEIAQAGGSTGTIMGNIWLYTMLFDCNARFSPIHNNIRGNIVKPAILNPAQAVVFPNNREAVNVMQMWAMTMTEFLNEVESPNPAAQFQQIIDTAVVVYINTEMSHISLVESFTLWVWAHCGYCVAKPDESYSLKSKVGANPVAQAAVDGFSTVRSSSVFQPSNAGVVNIIVVMNDNRTRLGALGQQNQNFTVNYGIVGNVLPVTTALNNPSTPGNVAVDITALTILVADHWSVSELTGVAAVTTDWWRMYYGSKYCLTLAKVYATLMSFSFLPVGKTTLTAGQADQTDNMIDTNGVINTNLPDATAATAQQLYDRCYDCFGQRQLAFGSREYTYYISKMSRIRMAALFCEVRAINDSQKLRRLRDSNSSAMAIFVHLLEIAEGIKTIEELGRCKAGIPQNALNGATLAVNSANYNLKLKEEFVDLFARECGVQNGIWSRPIATDVASVSTETSILTTVFDKTWEKTEFYTNNSTDIYRKTPSPFEPATLVNNYFGNNLIGNVDVMMFKDRVNDDQSKWLQPNSSYTQLSTVAQGYEVYLYEKGTLRQYQIWVNQLLDSANEWVDTYKGMPAVFNASDIILRGFSTMITDITIQPRMGPRLKQHLFISFNDLAQITLADEATPCFTAYKAVGTPVQQFNAPSMNEELPELTELLNLYSGGKYSKK
jgi:hypothetical protein